MCPDDATYLPADNWHNTKQQGKNIHGFFFYNIIFAIKFVYQYRQIVKYKVHHDKIIVNCALRP
jgi:hypothetical protein